MNHFLALFQKTIDKITEQDLISYFQSPRLESNTVEYKSYDLRDTSKEPVKISNIIRSVAAMLNSGGGIIIWGAPRPVKAVATEEHTVIGDLAPVDFLIGKDRFMEIVFNGINPSPKGIRFEPLSMADGGYIYLIEVPGSDYPPHQYDGRYYARFDSLTKAAPHHYVEALMKQVRHPLVKGFINFGHSYEGGKFVVMPAMMTLFNINRSIPAFNLSYEIIINGTEVFFEEDLQNAELDSARSSILKSRANLTLINNRPINRKFVAFTSIKNSDHYRKEYSIDLFFWADNIPLSTSRYRLTHQCHNFVNNSFSIAPIHENKFSADISTEDGKSEEEIIEELKARGIEAFGKDFLKSPFSRKLLD